MVLANSTNNKQHSRLPALGCSRLTCWLLCHSCLCWFCTFSCMLCLSFICCNVGPNANIPVGRDSYQEFALPRPWTCCIVWRICSANGFQPVRGAHTPALQACTSNESQVYAPHGHKAREHIASSHSVYFSPLCLFVRMRVWVIRRLEPVSRCR